MWMNENEQTKLSIALWQSSQISIGRSNDVTHTILSPLISRCHAVFRRQVDGSWTITDNKEFCRFVQHSVCHQSTNGVSVNAIHLKALVPFKLRDQDIVVLSVADTGLATGQFVYRFYTSLKVRHRPFNPRLKVKATADGAAPWDGRKDAGGICVGRCVSLAASEPLSGETGCHSTSMTAVSDSVMDCGLGIKKEISVSARRLTDEVHVPEMRDFQERLTALEERLRMKDAEIVAMGKRLHLEREQQKVTERERRRHEDKVTQLCAKQEQLLDDNRFAESKMQDELAACLHEQEVRIREQMRQQFESLAEEKRRIESLYRQEAEKVLSDDDRELLDSLLLEKEHLQKMLHVKALEQKALESELARNSSENDKVYSDAINTGEIMLTDFCETMERELQCSICTELFIKATSLNCSHSFCSFCIQQWLRVRNKCPNCRQPVTSQLRCIVLDGCVERIVDRMTTESRDRRKALVEERRVAEAELTCANKARAVGTSGNGQRGRRWRGSRNRHDGRRQRHRPSTVADSRPVFAITLRSRAASTIVISDDDGVANDDDRERSSGNSLVDVHYDWYDGFLTSDFESESNSSGGEPADEAPTGSGQGYYGGYGRC